MNRTYSVPNIILWFSVILLGGIGNAGFSQTPIPITFDKELSGTLSPNNPLALYTFTGTSDKFVEIIVDMAQRDFPITLTLFNYNNMVVDSNQGLNYPNFQGVYLYTQLPLSGNFVIQIEAENLTASTDYTIYLNVFDGDEPIRTLLPFTSHDGVIGPAEDYDEYLMAFRKGGPYLIYTITPKSILDSWLGVVDAQGNLLAQNDNFFTTASVLLFTAPASDTYDMAVYGIDSNAVGPYTIVVDAVPLFNAPFSTIGSMDYEGQVLAYEIQSASNQVYDFTVTGVDPFRASIMLTDAQQNIIAYNQSIIDLPVTVIPGFTPYQDGNLYLFIDGETPDLLGSFGLDVTAKPDEADGTRLQHGSLMSGVIGPVGDQDEYVFTAETGKRYSILVTPTWYYLDPAVRILDKDGKEVFYNDNSTDGYFSLLSNIQLPQPGDYRIQVLASLDQTDTYVQTGVYAIQLAEGATFDRGAPHIFEPAVSISPIAGGVHISIPTAAIADDTYPLSATLALDHKNQPVLFDIQKVTPVALDVNAVADEIFFITLSDSASTHNTAQPVTLPPPKVMLTHAGLPYALAIDQNNNLYFTDTQPGMVIKMTPNGATETIVTDLETGGGTYGPDALAFDHQGNLYLCNAFTHSVNKLLSNGNLELITDQLNFPVDIAFDQDGNLYIAQIGSDTIDRIDKNGKQTVFVNSIKNPNGLAFSPTGELFVCNSDKGKSSVYRVHNDGTVEPFVSEFAQTLEGIAFDREGYLYVADGISGLVYRISPDKYVIPFTRNLSGPVDLAFGWGNQSKILYACNMGIESPGYYYNQIIAIPTGRAGLPLPYGTQTRIDDWMLHP